MSETLYCSFCRKSQHQLAQLIAGPPGVYICDECVDLCAEICAGARNKSREEKHLIDVVRDGT